MSSPTQEEDLSARSYGLQRVRDRRSSGQRSLLRLIVAMGMAVAVLFVLGTGAARRAQAIVFSVLNTVQVESVLHSFTGAPTDGTIPRAGLIQDSEGNLYGTTEEGGSSTNCGSFGCGTVFEMVYDSSTNSYTEKVLYSFTDTDGAVPMAGLIRLRSGNLYGTTYMGGPSGGGTVFELSPPPTSGGNWTEKVLYSFSGTDGSGPQAGLVMDSAGNLYGTTSYGGSAGGGTVFELSPPSTSGGNWTEKVLYSFTGTDGDGPQAGLLMDSSGNLYGTTYAGGPTYISASSPGDGVVFELSPPATSGGNWTEKVLYSFTGTDGDGPEGGLVTDYSGNFYGSTNNGGSFGAGTVFELTPDTTSSTGYSEKVLLNFDGHNGGGQPRGKLIMDMPNFYSITNGGGSGDLGTIFELSPDSSSSTGYSEKVLYAFQNATNDGAEPEAGLVADLAGNLYGTTPLGGSSGHGTVFGIAPVTFSVAGFDFGSVAIGTTSAAQKVTITNIGGGNFSYSTASISGTNAADFSVTNGCSTAVAPNGTCPVGVTFTPSTATAETASLNLSQGGMTQTVGLTGTGVYPTTSFSSSNLAFSSQDVSTTSSAQKVTLTNTSNVTLNVTSVGITGDFAIASNNCTSVAAGKTCTVGVTFTPTASGARTGTLTFNDNTSAGSQTVALSGEGADFTLTARTTSETIAPGGTADFDLLLSPEGGFDQAINLACSNAPAHTTCTVNPTSVTLDGTNPSAFQVKVVTSGNAMVMPGGPGNFAPPSGGLPVAAWLAIIGLLGLIVLVKFSPKGGRVRRAAPWATLALAAALCAGCGGGSSSSTTVTPTPAGTYTLTVTGKSGSLTHTSQVTLTVK